MKGLIKHGELNDFVFEIFSGELMMIVYYVEGAGLKYLEAPTSI